MRTEREAYDELACYTLAHRDPAFPHQHVVDAFAAQQATAESKPIQLAFALVGLCLHCERGFSGRAVQRVHMILARRSRTWPAFLLPLSRGTITATDVMAAPPGPDRDRAIDDWCAEVWSAYREARPAVLALLAQHDIG